MDLIFEKSVSGRGLSLLPQMDVPAHPLPDVVARKDAPQLPELSEIDISRHYTRLARHTHGVNDGFYPLGSCTMKYNPRINEVIAALPGFADIHPLQPAHTVAGCREALALCEKYLCEITGMDAMSFQPAAGAHGELTGLMLIKAHHEARGEGHRTKIIVPDSAHGTNPASAAMVGYQVVDIPSGADGLVDLDALAGAVGADTAGLMLTNPNTVGLFEKDILKISQIVHDAGGLVYYDGANLNAVLGIARPGDMGFDVVHLNLHKTFSTPHGGGGPGSGPVGCKDFLKPYLPHSALGEPNADGAGRSIGQVRAFYGNFLVVVRALAYIRNLGGAGLKAVSEHAVLNANYMMARLKGAYDMAYDGPCMHEFVMRLDALKEETGVSALDVAKAMLDHGVHPPTMYFPLIVPEALMIEPTETESKETLDEVSELLIQIREEAARDPDGVRQSPTRTPVRRIDEVGAARKPVLKYDFS
ncbi:MAG: aminomethyl-transferring glycine dehydrogenase subunit GcvPB [Christensenellales bacterium]|jgi:glycine dehydrogenase subunit 2